MKKNFIIAGLLVAGLYSAQQEGSVGINAEPKGATLHVTIAAGATPTEGQGVAVPNVDKTRLNAMTGTIATSALVYVIDASGSDSSTTKKVKEVGYHYFDGTEWVKLGGGASSSSSTPVPVITTETSYVVTGNEQIIITKAGSTNTIKLPSASANSGRVFYISNMNTTASTLTITSDSEIIGTPAILQKRGKTVVSDGSEWVMISYN